MGDRRIHPFKEILIEVTGESRDAAHDGFRAPSDFRQPAVDGG